MRRAVWKYALAITEAQTLSLPAGAQVLSVQAQRNVPTLWALVDPTEISREVWGVVIVGTGHEVQLPNSAAFYATVQTHDGALVWHVFIAPPVRS